MTSMVGKVLKYEFLNIMRNRWVFVYTLIVAATTFSLQKISGDYQKTMLSLSSITVVLIPLIASLFTALYWYYSERFTHLMLTQPLPRRVLLTSRIVALSTSLSACFVIGTFIGSILLGQLHLSCILLMLIGAFLTMIFSALSSWISIAVDDRMKGVGLVFGFWLYLVLVHDGFILLALIALKNEPMDFPGTLLGVINPIGLGRVVLLMYNEGSMLLGHTGALVREFLTSSKGYITAVALAFIWCVIPLALSYRAFRKKDF